MIKFVIILLFNILGLDYVGHCFLFAEKDAPVPVYANYKDSVVIKKLNIDTCNTLTDVYIESDLYKNRCKALIIQERDTVSGFIDKKNLINYFDDSPRIKVLYEIPSYDSCVEWTIPVEEVPEGYLKVLSMYLNWALVQSVTKPEIKGWLAPVYSKSTANDPYFISEEKNYKSKHRNRSIKESLNNILDTNYIGCCSLIAEKDKWIPLYASDTDTTVVAHIINDAYREDYPNLHIIEKKGKRLLVDAKYIVYPYGRVHEDARGWIDIQYAGTHFLGFDENRVLYASPKRESDTCMCRANYQLLKIMDVDNYWLKVYSEGDESIKGWLAPEDSEVTGEAFDRLYPFLFFAPGTQIFDLDTRLSPYVSVYEIKGNKALVDIISEDGDLLYYKIWVDTDLLGTYIHNDCGSIDVYDNLDSEEVSFKINDGKWGVFYPVTDIWRLGWVKIVNPENRSQTGWLSPEYRSANQHFPTSLIR